MLCASSTCWRGWRVDGKIVSERPYVFACIRAKSMGRNMGIVRRVQISNVNTVV